MPDTSDRHLHNVFFALSNRSGAAIQSLIDDCRRYLNPIDGVQSLDVGRRTDDCTRDVNDQGFDVALTVVFRNRAAHDAYQICDSHNEFVQRNVHNWRSVRVFDSTIA